jgi:hypothetical protein
MSIYVRFARPPASKVATLKSTIDVLTRAGADCVLNSLEELVEAIQ